MGKYASLMAKVQIMFAPDAGGTGTSKRFKTELCVEA
jgi:hypothetical protein